QPTFDRSRIAALASQQTQQNFSMEVLTDFIDYADILQQRLGFVTGERNGLIDFQRTRLAVIVSASARRREGGHTKCGKRSEFCVAGALVSVDHNAALFE